MPAAATVVTLRPGAPGTKHLTAEYGERLICVRYRYDAARHCRLKTIEIIVEEIPWHPGTRGSDRADIVYLRIGYQERNLQRQIRQAGGRWRPYRKLWKIARDQALALGLANRIVK